MITSTLRKVKRGLLYNGYAKPIHMFLKDIDSNDPTTVAFHKRGKYVVNLSFDLEFAFNMRLWNGLHDLALELGQSGKENLVSIGSYLNERNTPYNVQIVGALLEEEAAENLPFLNTAQRNFISKHRHLFVFSDEHYEVLENSSAELGLHGFSHRSFLDLSRKDAEYELKEAQRTFEKRFGKKARFMSFPKNHVNHEEVLLQNEVILWRTNTQTVLPHTVPIGTWFAPGVLGEKDLRRMLRDIRSKKDGYFLHLWGHFTEMDVETFKILIAVIEDEGWTFESSLEYVS